MAFKLLEAAQNTWPRLDAHDLLPLIRAGIIFTNERSVERTGKEFGKGRRLITLIHNS